MENLEGCRALVTGGASGIGLATARRLTDEGARVAVADLDEAAAKEAASELGGVAVAVDVSDAGQVSRAFKDAADELGGLDLVHLNAGVTTGEDDIASLTNAQYKRILGANVDGVVYGTREAVRLMSDGGAIVCTASLAGIVAYPPDPIYALTKHAVVGLVRGLGPKLAERSVTINAVCPGIVETPLVGDEAAKFLKDSGFPLIQAEEIAEAVVRAVRSGESGNCWIIQPGREPLVYEFKGVPGPRVAGAEGMRPPTPGE